jgi:RNA polymerase-binding protein DksA
MAHQISSQRHSHDVKPLMDVTVTRYKDADLAIFKEVILKKIAKAKEEIDFYTDQIKNTSESETQFASIDDGSMTSERENMNQIVVRMQKLISHLESALVRIENKSYGICRETGKLIPKERLMVVPHATLSVEGKKLEKK